MNIEQIRNAINAALNTLRENDNYLLENDVSERAIAHRLAICLENSFDCSYDVDCRTAHYNRV